MRLNSLVVLAGVVLAIIWFWHASMGARERANAAAREACDRLRLVMLDGTVAIARLWFRRGLDGRLHFERTYGFEYTDDGYRRLRGFVVTLGEQVTSVGLASARNLHEPPDGPPGGPPGALPPH